MVCASHVMSHAPYVGICEGAASKKVRRLSDSSSSEIGPSVSQVISSIAPMLIGVSGINRVGGDKSMMFKTYRGPLAIHPRWYNLSLGTCRSSDLSAAPSRGEEHDARAIIRLYKGTMREDAMAFGDSAVHGPTPQELKIGELFAAYSSGNIDKVARIDEREEQRRKWKAYHRSVRKYHAGISNASSSKGNSSS